MKFLFMVFFILLTILPFTAFAAEQQNTKKIGVIIIKEDITQGTEKYISRAIKLSTDKGYDLLVIEMDTPGGLLMITKNIVQILLNSKIDTAVYVSPSGAWAGSAGVFITMAARYAYMAPGCNIGAAHPVNIYGMDEESDNDNVKQMAKKAENIAISWVEAIAKMRNRNIKWAIDSVSNSVAVTSEKALEQNVIDGIASNRNDMLKMIYGSNTVLNIFDIHKTWDEQMQTMPVSFVGLIFIVVGVVLLFMELFLPSFGTLTIGGVISLLLGSTMLFNANITFYQVMIGMIAGILITITGLSVGLIYLVKTNFKKKAVSGQEGIIGEKGPAYWDFKAKTGKIQVHGEIWAAVLETETVVKKGELLEVIKIDGLLLTVKKGLNFYER